MQAGDGGFAGFDDELYRLVVERVEFAVFVTAAAAAIATACGRGVGDVFVVRLALGFEVGGEAVDFFVVNEGAMHALRAFAGFEVEHVAVAQQ